MTDEEDTILDYEVEERNGRMCIDLYGDGREIRISSNQLGNLVVLFHKLQEDYDELTSDDLEEIKNKFQEYLSNFYDINV